MQLKYKFEKVGSDKVPFVDVSIFNKENKACVVYRALLDSGAYANIFHADIAEALDIDLEKIKEQQVFRGVEDTERSMTGKVYNVELMVVQGGKSHKFDSVVVFTDQIVSSGYGLLGGLGNQARETLAQIQAQDGNLNDAMANMEAISVGNHRVREQTEFVQKLLDESKEDEARQLVWTILNDVNANTSYSADKEFGEDDDGFDETIGSLDFLPKQEAEEDQAEEYEFRNYDRAEILSSLAKVLADHPQCRDLFDYCVHGNDSVRSIADSIALANRDSQSSLWSNLIEVFGRVGDKEQLDATYQRGCELYPDSVDFLTMEYAYALYDFDQEKALELIMINPDLERRANGFANFVRAQIEANGFSDWQELVAQLVKLEDDVLLPQQEPEFNIDDILAVEDDEDEDPDKQAVVSASSGSFSMFVTDEWPPRTKFWRKSPGLLANLSKIAIVKGEWDTFGKIFRDERMSPSLKVHVLSEIADWLHEGKEIKFWF